MPTPDLPVSMRDVAVRAGVTAATVSLALKASPLISAATRERVLAAARALGYRPNPLVQSLMRTRRRRGASPGGLAVAWITAFPTRDGWRTHVTPVFRQMFAGAQERASQCGYALQEFWLDEPGMTPRRMAEILSARGIRGLLWAPFPNPEAKLEHFAWEHFASVALGFSLTSPTLHRVASDAFHSMLISAEECHRLGYRRLGLVLSESAHRKVQRRWLAGHLLAARELPGSKPIEPLIVTTLTEENFRSWFKREEPDVIIAPTPVPIFTWLKAWGVRVPRDIGVVSLSSPRVGDATSGIYQNTEQVGTRAVDLLVTLLERNETGVPGLPNTLLVDGTWNPGRTVRRRKAAAVRSPPGRGIEATVAGNDR